MHKAYVVYLLAYMLLSLSCFVFQDLNQKLEEENATDLTEMGINISQAWKLCIIYKLSLNIF